MPVALLHDGRTLAMRAAFLGGYRAPASEPAVF
jgi:hypothetical protein